jgi:hypothetical protein
LADESLAIVSDCLIQSYPQGTSNDEHLTQPSTHLSIAHSSTFPLEPPHGALPCCAFLCVVIPRARPQTLRSYFTATANEQHRGLREQRNLASARLELCEYRTKAIAWVLHSDQHVRDHSVCQRRCALTTSHFGKVVAQPRAAMLATPQVCRSIQTSPTTMNALDASSWRKTGISGFAIAAVWLKSRIIVAAILLPFVLLLTLVQYRKMQYQRRKPFPFLELPQELRDMVYEHFLEDPVYPTPLRPFYQSSTLHWMKPVRWTSFSDSDRKSRDSTWIFLASKQVYAEYMDMLCKRKIFHLSVSPETYKPITPTTPFSPPPTPEDSRVWNISNDTLSKIRTCSLKLVTTSAMLGVTDPRAMTSSSWTLGQRMREQLKHMSSIKTFTLDAKALGDPLWNPLWIWFHASQSFKLLGTEFSDTVPVGPQLTKITFSLDTWSPGENWLGRDEQGKWMWYCMKDHPVGLDIGAEMTVREFCGSLYRECSVCRLEDGLDEEGEH